jgi:hypothetical protein
LRHFSGRIREHDGASWTNPEEIRHAEKCGTYPI